MAKLATWPTTYKRFLEHEQYMEHEEVEEQVQNAIKTVNKLPPDLKPKIVNYLNQQSRDDFVQIDWGMIEVLAGEAS